MASGDDCVYWLKKIYGRLGGMESKLAKSNTNEINFISILRNLLKIFKG